MESWREEFYLNCLMHHGVKGMKWGVRNGPPYPLKPTSLLTKINIKASNGVRVTSISRHAKERIRDRKLTTKDIIDALQNPINICTISTDKDGRKSQKFIGSSATVSVNPDSGTITTLWRTGQRTRNKYVKETDDV